MFTEMAGCAAGAAVSVGGGQLTSSSEDCSAVAASPSSLVRSCSTRGLGRRRTWPVRRCCVRGRRAGAWADTAARAAAPASLPSAARPSFQPRALREPGSRRRREERSDHPVPRRGQLPWPARRPLAVLSRRTSLAPHFCAHRAPPDGPALRGEYGCAAAARRGSLAPSAEACSVASAPSATSGRSTVRAARPRPHRTRSPPPTNPRLAQNPDEMERSRQ